MAESTKAKKKTEPTEYVVLERIEAPIEDEPTPATVWIERGETTMAGSSERKIIDAVVGPDTEGTFKAVAKRSWKGSETRAQTSMLKREKGD